MRALLFCFALASTVLPSALPAAQGMQLRTPNPDRVAADADWQIDNEPIVASGLTYYPTRETRFFDGQVMTQIDVYEGVPVYADMSIAPFTLAYVPLTPTRMRTYERGPDDGRWVISGRGRSDLPTAAAPVTVESRSDPDLIRIRSASDLASLTGAYLTSATPPSSGMETIPPPRGTNGVWVEFDSVRWYSDGPAEPFDAARFSVAGDYYGFAVYRERESGARIWITTTNGGLLTPYARR